MVLARIQRQHMVLLKGHHGQLLNQQVNQRRPYMELLNQRQQRSELLNQRQRLIRHHGLPM